MKRRNFLAASAMAASPLLPSLGSAQQLWRTAAPIPIRTQELYPAVLNTRLYVAGGIAAKAGVPYFTAACFSFDPATNRWSQEHDLPEKLHHAALVSSNNDLYQIGGFNGGYTHVWRMRSNAYKLTDDGWIAAVDLPAPQAEGVLSCAPDGAIHLVTGQSPRGAANNKRSDHVEVPDHWRWDTAAHSWERAAPIPTARNSATGGWVQDQLIVTGGRTASGNLSTTEIYDAAADRWHTAAPMPLAQAGTASVMLDNGLIVFGGEVFTPRAAVFANVWRYDIDRDEWAALPDLPTPRHGLGAGLIGREVYVIGGATEPGGKGTSNVNEVLTLA